MASEQQQQERQESQESQERKSRCACTSLFCQHLGILFLGIVGVVASILEIVTAFTKSDDVHQKANGRHNVGKGFAIWFLVTTVAVSVSGLQGLLERRNSCWYNCHTVLAVGSLVNLAAIGVARLVVRGHDFWLIYIVVYFCAELRATINRTPCSKTPPREVGMAGTELPIANPAGHQQAAPTAPASASVQHVVDIPAPSQPDKVDPRPEDIADSTRPHLGYDRLKKYVT